MKVNKNVVASIGAGIEYYDFIIFGHLAGVLSPIFFNQQFPLLSLIYSYLIFSMAYIVRPIGGLVAGLVADKFGRQKSFVLVMFCMAVATFIIGVLPTYQSIGFLAPILIIVCRLLQGLSFGAEMPSAITFVTENSTASNKLLNNSLLCSSATLGAILASFMMQLISSRVQDLWRIPFILGGSLAIIAFVLRKASFNTTVYPFNRHSFFEPLKLILQEYKINILLAVLFFLFTALLVISYVYYATYFSSHFNYTMQNVYRFSTIGLVACAIALPIFAKLFANKNQYVVAAVVALIFSLYQVIIIKSNVLHLNNISILGGFLVIHQVFIAAFNSVAYTVLAELFPAKIRATSVALVYNFAFMLASFLPAVTAMMIDLTEPYILLWTLASAGLTTFFIAIFYYLNNPLSSEVAYV